ncbi:MAG TPA: FecR family protein [Kiloniellales bacterium]|nr:FecR family protein [Kiloniellales bacterium]
MRRQLLAGVLALPLAMVVSLAGAEPIGNVGDLNGDAFGTPPQDVRRQLALADGVAQDEFVEVPGAGGITIIFVDGSAFHLGSNSSAKLDKFLYDPAAANGNGVVQLGQGVFRFISAPGTSHEGLEIQTPNSVIGIRGTDVVVAVNYQSGTSVGTLEGLAEARSKQTGQVVAVPPGDVAAIGLDGNATVGKAPVAADQIACWLGGDEYICLASLGGSSASGSAAAPSTFSGNEGQDSEGTAEAAASDPDPGTDPGDPGSDPGNDPGNDPTDPGADPGAGDPNGGGGVGDGDP